MVPQPMSPRLPGVAILPSGADGPIYRRWRRGVESAFKAKDTWGHCDGSKPMPMPESGPNFFTPVVKANSQPELLEERRAWVKSDRDVKLDIFLSIADHIKLEVFEVGPPLPPTAMTAAEMLQALDDRFEEFKFEDYHHCFCHFLNLHIDQYASLEDFNAEFLATLEDMLDHGFPLDNTQACSAYFSKLRCTQNPWVAKKLKEWDTLDTAPLLADLMKDCPPWIVIRPLATKAPSQQSPPPESYSEDLVESQGDEDGSGSDHDEVATLSDSSASLKSPREQEITVHASYEDLTEAFPIPTVKLQPMVVPQRVSSKLDISKIGLPPPANRPLPPIPSDSSSVRSTSSVPPSDHLKVPVTPTHRTTQTVAQRPQTPSSTPPKVRNSTLTTLKVFTPSPPSPTMKRPHSARGPVLAPQASMETFSTWPPVSSEPTLLRIDSTNSSVISLPLQGVTIPENSEPKPQHKKSNSGSAIESFLGPSLDGSPARSLGHRASRFSFEDDEKKNKKRHWSIKAPLRLSVRKLEVKEII